MFVKAEDKCREVEKLQTLLSSASEEKERMETRFSNICNISTAGLKSLRLDLSSVKSEVGGLFLDYKRDTYSMIVTRYQSFGLFLKKCLSY